MYFVSSSTLRVVLPRPMLSLPRDGDGYGPGHHARKSLLLRDRVVLLSVTSSPWKLFDPKGV